MGHDWNIVDDPDPTPPEKDESRLDANRIRAVMLERRAAHRTRQWTIARSIGCGVAAIALVGRAITWLTHDQHRSFSFAALAIAAGLSWTAIRQFLAWRALPRIAAIDFDRRPNFEALDDGSRRQASLAELREKKRERD